MFSFLTRLGKETADPLAHVHAAEACWRTLPLDDPIAAQMALCAVLAEANGRGDPDLDRVRALLALDQRGRGLLDTLLGNSISGNPQAPSQGLQSWQAAYDLCRSFGRAHGQFLKSMVDGPKFQGWNEYVPYVALHFFQHRQIELLLRPFIDEKSTRFPWKDLHDAYRFAQSLEPAHPNLPVNRRYSASAVDTTLEREYIHVLLQDLMNSGHFAPHEALWLSQAIPRWSESVVLTSRPNPLAEHGFVIDLDSDAGITRMGREVGGTCLGLDSTPVLKAMRDEFVALRDASSRSVEGSSLGSSQRRKVLAKLNVLCANERPVIVRRGERKPTALTVDVIVGMAPILSRLRNETQDAVVRALRAAADGEDATATAFNALSEPTGVYAEGASPAVDAAHPPLTMVDCSDSGCRLHGPTLGSNPIMPGTLIAVREEVSSPWTLAVVRRVKKRFAGKRVEIGVEYLGRDPRRVIVVGPECEAALGGPPAGAPPRFAALYLSESAKYPLLPMKTLVLPPRGLAPDDRLSVRSRTDAYMIQLKEPLDEQAEFIWSPFAIVDHRPTDTAAAA